MMDSTRPTKGGGCRRPSGDPAVVALRMEDLTRWVIQRVAKMPREHRFTIGDRLVETSLEVTTLLLDASFTRDKRTLLAQAARGLTRLRLLVRLAHGVGLMTEKQHLYLAAQTAEVGKMIGGWSKSVERRS